MDLKRIHIDSPLGPMILAGSDEGLAGIWFEDQRHLPDFTSWPIVRSHLVLERAHEELLSFFTGGIQTFTTKRVAAWGTAFQRQVWETLVAIPFGSTTTYGELARKLKNPQAVRAIGGAVGRNPWTIMVPCHRVLGADGSLTGYAGGLDRKIELLRLESDRSFK